MQKRNMAAKSGPVDRKGDMLHRVNLVLLRGTPGRGRFVARRTAADPVAGSPCRDCKMCPERGLWLEQRWERRPWGAGEPCRGAEACEAAEVGGRGQGLERGLSKARGGG